MSFFFFLGIEKIYIICDIKFKIEVKWIKYDLVVIDFMSVEFIGEIFG